ncbi:MAG: hypothetical protein ACRDVM_07035 [Acidimicrobiia bacterium]
MTSRPGDDETALAPLYLRSLVRVHLSISGVFLAAFAVLAIGLPVVFWIFPSAAALEVAGLPLVFLMLGLVVYPLLVLIGWLYVRAVEDAEEEFSELVDLL